MKKRANNISDSTQRKVKNDKDGVEQHNNNEDNIEELVYEDQFEDEFEEEDLEDDMEDVYEDYEDYDVEEEDGVIKMTSVNENSTNVPNDLAAENIQPSQPKQVWRPGVDQVESGEELDYDPSAYIMYHSMRTEWPCLSFDFLLDNLGDNRQRFPMSMFLACGSQADRTEKNKITLLKLSDLHKTHVAADSEGEESDDEDDDDNLDEDPTIDYVNVNHYGGINRIRCMPQLPGVVATMADTGTSHIYDLSGLYNSMLSKGARLHPPSKPTFSFTGHTIEGFALDWSSVVAGRLATGDGDGNIHIWNNAGGNTTNNNGSMGGSWQVDNNAYKGHTGSVEDLQWSPSEGTVFCSASADKTVRVWDIRGKTGPQITVTDAHTEDVNVISWNKTVGYLLASGSDDGSFKVWDLRSIKKSAPLAHFTFHKGPITSIEWAPHDESVISVAGADDQVTIWDLSVEADEDETVNNKGPIDPALAEFPPQLLFIHQGQFNVKELHFHPQIPGTIVTTAEDSFNIFKPAISVST
eukprot:gene7042-9617_t